MMLSSCNLFQTHRGVEQLISSHRVSSLSWPYGPPLQGHVIWRHRRKLYIARHCKGRKATFVYLILGVLACLHFFFKSDRKSPLSTTPSPGEYYTDPMPYPPSATAVPRNAPVHCLG